MGRRKGTPMYGTKSEHGSYYLTRHAGVQLRKAARRSGKSESDVIEYCIRAAACYLTRVVANEIADGRGKLGL